MGNRSFSSPRTQGSPPKGQVRATTIVDPSILSNGWEIEVSSFGKVGCLTPLPACRNDLHVGVATMLSRVVSGCKKRIAYQCSAWIHTPQDSEGWEIRYKKHSGVNEDV
jgi:hypothetical protein